MGISIVFVSRNPKFRKLKNSICDKNVWRLLQEMLVDFSFSNIHLIATEKYTKLTKAHLKSQFDNNLSQIGYLKTGKIFIIQIFYCSVLISNK
jgi:hypothetical protein